MTLGIETARNIKGSVQNLVQIKTVEVEDQLNIPVRTVWLLFLCFHGALCLLKIYVTCKIKVEELNMCVFLPKESNNNMTVIRALDQCLIVYPNCKRTC
jgi:hypothetical protein